MSGPNKRRIFATRSLELKPYDLDGPLQPEMAYARLSYDVKSERGSYLMRVAPGAVLTPGDWVVYEPGSHQSDPARRTGTLFLNPGGPGGSGVAALASRRSCRSSRDSYPPTCT